MADTAKAIMEKAKKTGCEIILPVDALISAEFKDGADASEVLVDAVPEDMMILDIGSKSVDAIVAKLASCKTLIWNGPVGAFEITPFNRGTNAIAFEVAGLTKEGKLLSVAGGGDTVSALNKAGVEEDISYISAAGGAFLEWMEGKVLPGVKALEA
ncbi:MAG: Phosphoglycerate kinase [Alphaproteobacteria bacterium ADurb.Bin438]|nr:MAG: Phosphoglycerate kinase [Alphaproteobacteria bacterium ADurb.Bin438]